MLEVGFVVEKKRAAEATLRVYPVKNKQYPLLNPFYRNSGREWDNKQNSECLVIAVLSRDVSEGLDRHLVKFRSGLPCCYVPSGANEGGYHCSGHFLMPLLFVGQAYRMDFESLREPLTAIFQYLRRW